jgi:hypothetical protein
MVSHAYNVMPDYQVISLFPVLCFLYNNYCILCNYVILCILQENYKLANHSIVNIFKMLINTYSFIITKGIFQTGGTCIQSTLNP